MGGSSSKSESKPVDMTPEAFKKLQEPYADVLQGLIGSFNSSNGENALIKGYKGPLTAKITGREQLALNQLAQISKPSTTVDSLTKDAMSPKGFGAISDNLLSSTAMSGSSPDAVNQFVQSLGLGPKGTLADFTGELAGASQTGAFGADAGNNPFAQAFIDQAQRQTMQNLEETLGRSLPGRFALAGQSTQPGGSSAFDRAAAIATRGATQEMGDIASRISYQALEAARGREASALENELGRRGEGDARIAQAKQAQLDRALTVPGMEADIQSKKMDSASKAAQIQSQEVDTVIKNLQAQALPRLIKDLGVERGMEAFNNQVNSLLSMLGMTAGVSRPVISSESKSSSGGFQLK